MNLEVAAEVVVEADRGQLGLPLVLDLVPARTSRVGKGKLSMSGPRKGDRKREGCSDGEWELRIGRCECRGENTEKARVCRREGGGPRVCLPLDSVVLAPAHRLDDCYLSLPAAVLYIGLVHRGDEILLRRLSHLLSHIHKEIS